MNGSWPRYRRQVKIKVAGEEVLRYFPAKHSLLVVIRRLPESKAFAVAVDELLTAAEDRNKKMITIDVTGFVNFRSPKFAKLEKILFDKGFEKYFVGEKTARQIVSFAKILRAFDF